MFVSDIATYVTTILDIFITYIFHSKYKENTPIQIHWNVYHQKPKIFR